MILCKKEPDQMVHYTKSNSYLNLILLNVTFRKASAARTRSFDDQKLGPDFFEKEHTKPLFNVNKILTVHNL